MQGSKPVKINFRFGINSHSINRCFFVVYGSNTDKGKVIQDPYVVSGLRMPQKNVILE
jgi:hypothetical protein